MNFIRPLHEIGVLEAAAGCNLRCPSCVAWTQKGKDLLTEETTHKAVELFKGVGVKQVQMYWRGDPCIHPELYNMNKIVHDAGFITIVSTNGVTKYCGSHDYMEKLLKYTTHYAVCLDGFDADTLPKYRRGARWETMINNLQIASEIQTDCDKILSVLMFKYNEGKEYIFQEIADKYGFRVQFKAPNVLGEYMLTQEQADEWLPLSDEYNRYDKIRTSDVDDFFWRGNKVNPKELGEYVYIHRNGDKCTSGNLIIAANGTIPNCGQFTKETDQLGSVNDSLEDILNKYGEINDKMYHRQLPECSEKCLCIVKPR